MYGMTVDREGKAPSTHPIHKSSKLAADGVRNVKDVVS